MKVAILTLGCKTNQAESLSIEQRIRNSGHEIVKLSDSPDLCIINTCTVTSKADLESRQLLNRAMRNKAKVILTGCYAELNQDTLKSFYDNIEVVGNSGKDDIVNKIPVKERSEGAKPVITRHRPAVKIQDGCNYNCSYCIIPRARGRSRSITAGEIIEKINEYESLGYKEVVLTGIHIGHYGIDLHPGKNLSWLIKEILAHTRISRIRISSLEINEIDGLFIELLKEKRICPHLHIPLQSGDSRILSFMRRPYSINDFVSGVEKILLIKPDIAIGTDVIAGFPGEGEDEFEHTRQLVSAVPFAYIHVFPYSKRPGTKANDMPGQVDDDIKKKRVKTLRDMGREKRVDYIKRHIGKTIEVIFEEKREQGIIGTSDNYIKAFTRCRYDLVNTGIIRVSVRAYEDGMAIVDIPGF